MTFIEKASEAIRAAGGRMTPQRQMLIELLADATQHVDAETLYQLAREHDPGINLTTVYRTLDALEAKGLIRQHYISPEHDRKYYSPAVEVYHFTCRKCRRVLTFTSEFVTQLKHQLETDLHVQSLNACVCVDGLCSDCQAEAISQQEEIHMDGVATLDQLAPGQKARVKKVGGQGAVRRRLMDMGLVRGVEIELLKAAPMGDPLEYRLRGYHLSLRKAEAKAVEIDL